MSKIEKELVAKTGVARKEGWEDQTWFAALARAALKLDEDDFDTLSDDAQEWANAAGVNMNEAKTNSVATTIVGFGKAAKTAPAEEDVEEEEVEEEDEGEDAPEADEDEDEAPPASGDEDDSETEDEPEEEKPAKAAAPAKKKKETTVPKEKKPAKAAKPAKESAEEKPKRKMASHVIRRLCIKNRKKTEEEVLELAKAELGPKLSEVTFRGHYSGAVGLLKMLETMGYQIVKAPKPEPAAE